MDIYKGVLTLEEKILLESLETTDKDQVLLDLEELLMTTPQDDEAHSVLESLYEKLRTEYLNIAEELAELSEELDEGV